MSGRTLNIGILYIDVDQRAGWNGELVDWQIGESVGVSGRENSLGRYLSLLSRACGFDEVPAEVGRTSSFQWPPASL